MELSPKQQVTELIRKFQRVLIVTHARPDGDALGSALAMHQVLEALGKEPTTVVYDDVPEMLQFMPDTDKLSKELKGSRDLVVSLDISKVPVDKLKYNTRDGKLNVVITPKQGSYSEKDVTLGTGGYKFDVIMVLDCPDLDRTGKLYEDHPDLFYETPVINIDHHPSNDYFGAVNLVDLTATSTSEILVGVIEALGPSLMTEDVATNLLTGLITDTGSFQNSNTTPKSLTVSAQLVAAGGRQQEIIQHVYKTKPISTLKLWGRALTKLQYDPEARMVWSSLSTADFADTGGTPTDAKAVIDALMTSAPDAEVILLLREGDKQVDGSVRTTKGVDATKIVGFWNGGGHTGAAGFDVAGSLVEVEPKVVQQIRNYQLERLGKVTAAEREAAFTEHATRPKEQPQAKEQPQPKQPEASKEQPQPQSRPQQSEAPKQQPQPKPQVDQPPVAAEKPAPESDVKQEAQPEAATKAATPQNTEAKAPVPATTEPQEQPPLTDEQLDAYFRKTLGGKDAVIDQPTNQPADDEQA